MYEIKQKPEDFVVNEITNINTKDSGAYGIYLLKKTNYTTERAVQTIANKLNRKAKEDLHRLKGTKGNWIVYKVTKPISSWKVYSFYPEIMSDFIFWVSHDGKHFNKINPQKENYASGVGAYELEAYGYYKPVLYHSNDLEPNVKFLKIEYTTQAEISRIEILYGP